jgi:hypothetical protein
MRQKQTNRNSAPKRFPLKKSSTENQYVIPDAFTNTPKPIMLEIFSYLDFRQLFTIRRVCSKWKELISDNQSLFEKLFVRNLPQYASNKPVEQTWQEFYLRTLHASVGFNFESVELKPEFFIGDY